MKKIKALFGILITAALVYALNTKIESIPPLGKFLSPFVGFWQNAESSNPKKVVNFNIKGLKEEVTILLDDNMVPHIFAKNKHDLYLAQGYITAYHRLWQMDFQTRYASGRLSEVVGKQALELDRYQRRIGLGYGAEKAIEAMLEDPQMKEVVEAYSAGINAYIQQLSPKNYPIEFKILNYSPEEWKPINSALLLKLMTLDLAGANDDLQMTNILKKFGPDITRDLFPNYPYKEDPIIPPGTIWEFNPLPVPAVPEEFIGNPLSAFYQKEKIEGIGSNNWAVSGTKTASGFPILSNDPHLGLTLPSIWYQVQLHGPDVNVYGVSLPGAPSVIIGMNNDAAWGVTNVGSDVLDWYQVKFKDAKKEEYWWDEKWNPITKRVETIKTREGKTVTDTVLYTHHGPIVYLDGQKPFTENTPIGYAMRWIAHEKSNELKTFYLLNRAQNYTDYRNAISHYHSPAQNFIYADSKNDIGISPNGKFPLKWQEQGKFLLDGSKKSHDWQSWIPFEHNPTVKNPARGFVSSANQFSTDLSYPYYLGFEFAPTDRGIRINNLLSTSNKTTADSMQHMQMDSYAMIAEWILPTLIDSVNVELLNDAQKTAFDKVKNWNKFYTADEIGASIFDVWRIKLSRAIFQDEFVETGTMMRYPSRDRTTHMILNEPNSPWYDNNKTPQIETLKDLINLSFKQTVDSLTKLKGDFGDEWQWWKVRNTHVPHLARIPGFGTKTLKTDGAKSTINALGSTNGPSWRVVVELGSDLKAKGLYPGGQSGNPGSPWYDNMVDAWTKGELYELLFLKEADANHPRIIQNLTLKTK